MLAVVQVLDAFLGARVRCEIECNWADDRYMAVDCSLVHWLAVVMALMVHVNLFCAVTCERSG